MDPQGKRSSSRFKAWVNRLISGKAPSDPLYLSNRSMWDRLWPWIAAAAFFTVMLVGWRMAVPHRQPVAPVLLPDSKIAGASFPRFASSKLEVLGVEVLADGSKLVGAVRNKTGQTIARGRLSFELQDGDGQYTGATEMDLRQIPPGKITKFELPIRQEDTRVVLVTGISVE